MKSIWNHKVHGYANVINRQARRKAADSRFPLWLLVVCCAVCAVLLTAFYGCTENEGDDDITSTEITTKSPDATGAETTAGAADNTEVTTPAQTEVSTEVTGGETTAPDTEETTEEPEETVDISELAAALSGSIYRSEQKIDSRRGITDASVIGIDPTCMEHELYTAPDDDKCACVLNASDYGISPDNNDNSPAMKKLLELARSFDGEEKIVFDAGVYRFSQTILIHDIDNISIVCPSGMAEVMMTSWCRGFLVEQCDGFLVSGIALDYENPSAVSGVVVSTDAKAKL